MESMYFSFRVVIQKSRGESDSTTILSNTLWDEGNTIRMNLLCYFTRSDYGDFIIQGIIINWWWHSITQSLVPSRSGYRFRVITKEWRFPTAISLFQVIWDMYEDTIIMKCFQVMNKARREDIRIMCCQEDGAQVLNYSDEEWEVIVCCGLLEAR